MFCLTYELAFYFLPAVEIYNPFKPLGLEISRRAYSGDRVGIYKHDSPSLVFYSEQKIESIRDEAALTRFISVPGKFYLTLRANDMATLPNGFKNRLTIIQHAFDQVLVSN